MTTEMTDPAGALRGLIQTWDSGAWCLGALALATDPTANDEQRAAAGDVLRAAGAAANLDGLPAWAAEGIGGQARAPLMQIAAMVADGGGHWAQQSDDALIAQGRASAQSARLFGQLLLPSLDGLAKQLGRPGAQMLDVGVGVAAQAVAFAEVFAQLTVVGIDVLPRVLELATAIVAASDVSSRVQLREQDVCALTDDACYDLAFVPAPFVPVAALSAGLPRVKRALRPGGWLCLGHGKFNGTALENALTRFKTIAYGGTALDDDNAHALCTAAGLVDVRSTPTPPGAPAITVGRRPLQHA